MRTKLHNRISRSVATLPVAVLATLLLWWLPLRTYTSTSAAALALALFVGGVFTEMNVSMQLLRVRSRMVAAVWLLAVSTAGFLHAAPLPLLVAACLLLSYYALFRSYQQPDGVVHVFHAFLALSVGSLFFPPLLLCVPCYLWHVMVFMRSLSLRTLSAGLLGLLLPFWFLLGYMLWLGDWTQAQLWWDGACQWFTLDPLSWLLRWHEPEYLAFLLWNALLLWTAVSFLLYSYDDKIRVRMMFYVFLFQSVVFFLLAVLFPHGVPQLFPLLLLSSSPLAAHHFALRSTWASAFSFLYFVVLLVCVTCFTL